MEVNCSTHLVESCNIVVNISPVRFISYTVTKLYDLNYSKVYFVYSNEIIRFKIYDKSYTVTKIKIYSKAYSRTPL